MFIATTVCSQDQLRLLLDTNVIHVGDPLGLRVEFRLREAVNSKFNWPDSIPHMEWVEKNSPTVELRGKEKWLVQKIKITSYDTGRWVIPPVELTVKGKRYLTGPAFVAVYYSSSSLGSNYHDIKDIVAVPAPANYWPYWISAFLILVAALLFYRKKQLKRKAVASKMPTLKINPFDEAMQEMKLLKEQLKQKHPEMKSFYTLLVDIFRKYLRDQHNFSSMEKTNGELIAYLHTSNLPADQLNQLVRQLELADAVKFAMQKPSHEEAEKSFFLLELAMKYMNH